MTGGDAQHLQERLARLLGGSADSKAADEVGAGSHRPRGAEAGDHLIDERSEGYPDGLERGMGPAGAYLYRQESFPASHAQGLWTLGEVVHSEARAFEWLCGDPSLASLDPRQVIYLDTETTGLSGGAGTYVFMVGLGWFEGEEFMVWQGFLDGPGEERALLAETARRLGACQAVVSFFGKSFDRHRLEDKMRIAGVASPFGSLPHLDLYHPLKRLTLGLFENNRLQTQEAGLLGFQRVQDLPGSLAPAAWFDFLADRPHQLRGVFHHNLLDVLSLVSLTAYLGHALKELRAGGQRLSGCPVRRAQAIGLACWSAGERELAIDWLLRAVERMEAGDVYLAPSPEAQELVQARQADEALRFNEVRWALGERLRLSRRDEDARDVLLALAAQPVPDALPPLGSGERRVNRGSHRKPPCQALACEALAKLYEHRLGDRAQALRWTERAIEMSSASPAWAEALKGRRNRLMGLL